MTVKPRRKNVYFEWTVCSPARYWDASSLLSYVQLAVMAIILHHTPTKLQSNLQQYVTYRDNVAPNRTYGSDRIANCWCGLEWQTGNTVHSPSAFSIHFTNIHTEWGIASAGGRTLPRYSEVSLSAATLCWPQLCTVWTKNVVPAT